MLFSEDGYYYQACAGEYLEKGGPAPLISLLAASLVKITRIPLEKVTFYLPVAFSLGLGILAAAWGKRLEAGGVCSLFMVAATGLIPAWLERSGLGWFDTDPLIALFWQTELFFLAGAFEKPDGIRSAFPALAGAGIAAALLSWAWPPGVFLAAGSAFCWALFFVPRAAPGQWRRRMRAAGGALAAIALVLALLPPGLFPAVDVWRDFAQDHFKLAFGLNNHLFYSSIAELQGAGAAELLTKLGGTIAGGVGALLAGALLFVYRPAARLPLFLGAVCLAAGLLSRRFLYLATFPLGLGVGMAPRTAACLPIGVPDRVPRWCGAAVAALVIAGSGYWAANRDVEPRWRRGQDAMALFVRDSVPPAARIWNWWDDGYFLKARARRDPFFHGGSQTPTRGYAAARPSVLENAGVAAAWIRFFAIRGEDGLRPLVDLWGEREAWTRLERLLETEDAADMERLPGGRAWLFPEGDVYWYLPNYFLDLSQWWAAIGHSSLPEVDALIPHLQRIKLSDFRYVPEKKQVVLDKTLIDMGYRRFGAIMQNDASTLFPPWPKDREPYIVYSRNRGQAYIVDSLLLRSVPFRLLTSEGRDVPGFAAAYRDADGGGVWKVLP